MNIHSRFSKLARKSRADELRVALVNNMPEPAVLKTQQQFLNLVSFAAAGAPITFNSYCLPGVAQDRGVDHRIGANHRPVDELYAVGADLLIVTGAEPKSAHLTQETYWSEFVTLVNWARHHTLSTYWSCLAAHFAVYALDGIERRKQPQKLSGVFQSRIVAPDFANRGAGETTLCPHSRLNGVEAADLLAAGYALSTSSEHAGPEVFWRLEPSLFIFNQGHPEYDGDTLAREYRRDILRWARSDESPLPEPPTNYFAPQIRRRIFELKRNCESRGDYASKLTRLISELEFNDACWKTDARRLFRNWFIGAELSALSREF